MHITVLFTVKVVVTGILILVDYKEQTLIYFKNYINYSALFQFNQYIHGWCPEINIMLFRQLLFRQEELVEEDSASSTSLENIS